MCSYTRLILATSVLVSLLFLLSFSLYGAEEIVVTTSGTYIKTQTQSLKQAPFIPDSFFFSTEKGFRRLERVEWRFETEGSRNVTDGRMQPATLTAQALKWEKIRLFFAKWGDKALKSDDVSYLSTGIGCLPDQVVDLLRKSEGPEGFLSSIPFSDQSKVYPTYLGKKLVSYLKLNNLAEGWNIGNASMFEREVATLTAREGEKLTLADLFSNWKEIKELLIEEIMEEWDQNEEDSLKKIEKTLSFTTERAKGYLDKYRKELKENLRKKGGDRRFLLTHSKEGPRLNIIHNFGEFAFGFHTYGGRCWLSLPIKDLSPSLAGELIYSIPSSPSCLNRFALSYFSPDTTLVFGDKHPQGIGEKPPKEFLIYRVRKEEVPGDQEAIFDQLRKIAKKS